MGYSNYQAYNYNPYQYYAGNQGYPGGGSPSGYANPYADPYADPYANPYGSPYTDPYANPYGSPYGVFPPYSASSQPYAASPQMTEEDAIRLLADKLDQIDNLSDKDGGKERSGIKDGQISREDLQAVVNSNDKNVSDEMKAAANALLQLGTISRMDPTEKPPANTKDGLISFDTFKNWRDDYTTNSLRADGPKDIQKAMDVLNANFAVFQDGDPNKLTVSWTELQLAMNTDNPKYTPQLKATIQYLKDHKDEFDKLDALDGHQDGKLQADVITEAIASGTTPNYGWDTSKTKLEDTTKDENRAAWDTIIAAWDKVDAAENGQTDGIINADDIRMALDDTSGKFTAKEKAALLRIFTVRDKDGHNLWDQVKRGKHKHLSKESLQYQLSQGRGLGA